MNQNSEHPGVLSPLKQALFSLETMQSKLDAIERSKTEPLAIIGMGCRFPGGANNPEGFWQLLRDGMDTVAEMPQDRWDVKAYHDPDPDAPGKIYTRYGSFLNDIDKFDAEFFNISPREARSLDPQQRLLLEVAWEALENAGQAPDRLAGSQTGVFMGIMTDDYSKLHVKADDPTNIDAYFVTGVNFSFAAGRLSYVLGLHGPSLSIDTACSSSLVAVHLACRSLRSGECDLALAGGVSLILSPELYITLSRFRALSADGRCKTFDAAADGFGRGEGCGVVVLKRLSDAVANGDNILALIRGSAVNHDGPSGGLTVPNGLAQQAMIRQALTDARVRPAEVSYVEAHGTGTSLGDPIEVRALGAVLGEGRAVDNRLMIGSAKSNIGHLDSAAGVAGLIKLVLSMQNEEIPPLLHFKQINPHISLNESPVTIPTSRTPWPAGNQRRIAGVSSFGLSGTNAHAVVEEAPAAQPGKLEVDRPLHLLNVSAKSEVALKELVGRFEKHLTAQPLDSLADICFTANTGRSHFSHRLAVVAESSLQMQEKLGTSANGQKQPGVMSGQIEGTEQPKVAFLFTGQGSQYVDMGRQLYETQPTFRAALDNCNELLRPHLEQQLLSVLYPESGSSPLLDETAYTQPALFAIEYALAELWQSWGIEPAIVLGHSVGEYVAACVAGVFSLENGLKLIAERGRLMQALPRDGMMAVVFAEEERVEAAIAPYFQSVSIAAYNGPKNMVISGERTAVQTVIEKLRNEKVKTQPLNVSHAFHSPLMEPMLDAFEQTARQVNYNPSHLPLVSNLTGQILSFDEIPDTAYWRRHIRQGVRFSATMQTLQREGYTFFLEIGPSPTLLGMGKLCIPDAQQAQVWLPSLRKNIPDWQQMLESLGTLYVHGADVDHEGFERDYASGRRRVALPTYPFQREHYWLERGEKQAESRSIGPSKKGAEQTALHPLLGQRLRSALKEIQFEAHWHADSPSFLTDHRVYGTVVVPGTAYVEMALAAASAAFGPGNHLLEEVTIQQALILPDASPDATVVQLILTPEGAEKAPFQVVSLTEKDNWKVHVTGNIRLRQADREALLDGASLSAAQARCQEKIDATTFYAHLRELGLQYGPCFQGITQIWKHQSEVLGEICLPEALANDLDDYRIHPALLDAAFQLLLATAFETGEQGSGVYLPVGMKRIGVYQSSSSQLWGQIIVKPNDAENQDSFAVDVRLFNGTGQIVAEVEDLYLRRASREALQRAIQTDVDSWLYEVAWEIQESDAKLEIRNSREKAGEWLILADQGGVGAALAERLKAQGESCVLVFPGESYTTAKGGPWQVNPSRPDDFQRLLQEALETVRPLRGVVYLWGLDSEPGEETAQAQICGGALHLVQALATKGNEGFLGLWLVTRGAQPAGPEPTLLAVAQATLWGLGGTIATEHPGLHCVRVDLDPWPETDQSEVLFREACSSAGETQVAFRGANRWVARMVRHHRRDDEAEHCLVLPKDRAFQLDVNSRGLLDTLVFRPTTLHQPGPGEVEIRVRATGLNFKDVLKALGRYPGTDSLLGDECSGTITAVGEGVERWHVGDEVVGVAYGSFRSSVVTRAELVVPKPHNLSFAQAVTMPIAFLTAYYTLHHLAKISAGKRVLIHAAAGGVGMAAVQLAQLAGAEIFATAGSPRKRALLRSLGVQHVLDSRTLAFADEVMDLTKGRGVDIVLNSLAGDFIPKSLSLLAPRGCFLEIGKTGIWDESQVARFKPDANYFVFYLGDIVDAQPGMIQEMLCKLMASIQSGALEPLTYRVFPIQEAIGAFRYMAQAKHIGKIVLTQEERTLQSANETFFANATYLITGGLGGLGLKAAEWLVTHGARNLVLVGRSGTTGDAGETVRKLEETGARVVVARANVSQQDQIAKVIAEIDDAMPPLRGIIHAAGVLDDGVLLQQKWERFARVMSPKVDGAWNLHLLTKNKLLDFFVLFSSTAPILGAAGQGNYAAANAFLDALAHLRQAQGLPALSINWGPWSEVGMVAAADDHDQRRLSDQGMDFISPAQGVQILAKLLHQSTPQMVVLPIDWTRFCQFSPAALEMRLITHFTREIESPVGEETEHGLTRQGLLAAAPPERQQLMEIYLRDQVAKVLQLPAGSVDALQPLNKLGFDSLMALELLNRIETDLKVTIPMAQFLQGRTVSQLTALLLAKLTEGVLPESKGAINSKVWALQPVPRNGELPLSFAQQRMWFVDQFEPNSALYNNTAAMHVNGPLNVEVLQRALNAIVSRHEVLRTTFATVDGVPVQVIAPTKTLELKMIDLSHVPTAGREEKVQRTLKEVADRPFNLSSDLILRATLLKLAATEHILLISLHHIASDGWSSGILWQELATLYAAFSRGEHNPLPELPIQYADYAVWQRQWLQGEVLETQLSYWKQRLQDVVVLQLPTDRSRPAMQSYRGATESPVFAKGFTDQLEFLSRQQGATLFMTLLAAFQTLLHRYSRQEDIVVGTPIAGRTRSETEGLIGFFVNTLVLRSDLSANPTFRELLTQVRKVALEAYEHQDLPFEKLVEELHPDRDLSRSPLFQVMFAHQNVPRQSFELPGLTVRPVEIHNDTAKFDLSLFTRDETGGLKATLEYNTDLYDAATIKRLLGHFEVLLEGIVANPDQRLSELPILTEAERHQLLVEWNDTKTDYPNDKCIHELFEAQVERTPDAIALVFEDKELTYRELNCRANQLAHYLRKRGVNPDELVGICVERSLEMIVGLLAILKAGGAYVPLDPAFPKERLAFKMQDAGLKLVVTQHKLVGGLPQDKLQTICLDTDWGAVAQESSQNTGHHAAMPNRAYVIYTSGSTGKPKGVEITHDAVVNFLRSMQEQPGLTDQDVLLAVTTVSFDIAGLELYLPLIVGARVVIVSREVAADGAQLMKYMTQAQATVMQATPATWRMLLNMSWQGGKQLKILCGGEALPGELAGQLLDRGASLWNLYGPTESTIWSTLCRVRTSDISIPIGRPIANTKVYILDRQLGLVPIGVPGELHISGTGLARGYLNRPELTAEKFIPSPFSDEPGARLYKTGDLARYLPDGNIECLGRIDHQVKIRGFRIELGEIEAVLCQHPNVRETVVVAREDMPGEKRLVGYIVPSQETAPTISELRNFLQVKLPDYMIPSAFVMLEALPLTPNGKVDRRALPLPGGNRDPISTFTEPRNDVERQLVRIWQEALGVDHIGTRDNFFELGGHSLLAARMFAQLEKCLKIRVPLAILFQTPTIEGLAAAIDEGRLSESWRSLVPIQPAGSRPPLFAVPGVGGNVLGLYDLARLLGPEQPFYGLQSRGLNGTEKLLTSIEEIATVFLGEIREVQREGPYYLVGGCIGGVVAYEMAQQLRAAGQEVGLLVLVDTPLPERTSERQPRHFVRMFAALHLIVSRLRLYVETLARLRGRQRFEYLLERLKMLTQIVAQRDAFQGYRSEFYMQVVTQANLAAFQRYQPRIYPGHVVHILAGDRKVASDEDPRLGWSRLVAGSLEIYNVPGDDSGLMMTEQNVPHLARQLEACLKECMQEFAATVGQT